MLRQPQSPNNFFQISSFRLLLQPSPQGRMLRMQATACIRLWKNSQGFSDMLFDCTRRLVSISCLVRNTYPLEHDLYAPGTLFSWLKASDTNYDMFLKVKRVLYYTFMGNVSANYIELPNYSDLEPQITKRWESKPTDHIRFPLQGSSIHWPSHQHKSKASLSLVWLISILVRCSLLFIYTMQIFIKTLTVKQSLWKLSLQTLSTTSRWRSKIRRDY